MRLRRCTGCDFTFTADDRQARLGTIWEDMHIKYAGVMGDPCYGGSRVEFEVVPKVEMTLRVVEVEEHD
jgi:hypothetical protein